MSYAAWSVVFGEQPSAAKWNILGTNDSSFNDGTGIGNLEIGSGHTAVKLDYKFAAYRNSALSTGNGSYAVIVFDTKDYDTGTNFATGTGLFTAPIAGFYHFTHHIETTTSNTFLLGAWYKNGANYADGGGTEDLSVTTQAMMFSASLDISLAQGDTLGVAAQANSAASFKVGASPRATYFSGFLNATT